VSSAGIFRTRGILQTRTSAIFGAKASDFSKSMVRLHEQEVGGLSQSGKFADKREVINFLRFFCGHIS